MRVDLSPTPNFKCPCIDGTYDNSLALCASCNITCKTCNGANDNNCKTCHTDANRLDNSSTGGGSCPC